MSHEELIDYVDNPEKWVVDATCPLCGKVHALDHKARDIENDLKYTCPGCNKIVFFEEIKERTPRRVELK